MRTAMIAILACLTLSGSQIGPASAQIPTFEIHFNDSFTRSSVYCRGFGVVDRFNIVARNFNMFMSTVEFAIQDNGQGRWAWIGDHHRYGSLYLGASPTGVTITYPQPLNAFEPVWVMRYKVLWFCDIGECATFTPHANFEIAVVPHNGTGFMGAIEFGTFRVVSGYSLSSLVCPNPYPTEETTWGGVKALYRPSE